MKTDQKWGNIGNIPAQPGESIQHGLAGALIGIDSDNLVIAGGSNFPDARPWEGGTKTNYDKIFFISLEDEQAEWKLSNSCLPKPIAYPACVSVPGGIVSIGGENQNGPIADVIMLRKENSDILIEKLSDLPLALTNACAAYNDSLVYVAGVSSENNTNSSFYCADISGADFSWVRLTPIPVPLSNATMVSQWDGVENCIYVLGGRNKEGHLTSFFSKVWKYSPSSAKWHSVGEIASTSDNPVTLAAGTGVAIGNRYIALFGGDNGELFNKTEELIYSISTARDSALKEKITEQKKSHLTNHPGFDQRIFLFDTHTKKCSLIGEIPVPSQVTTTAVKHRKKIIIPNGEIKPGIRTSAVNYLSLKISDTE